MSTPLDQNSVIEYLSQTEVARTVFEAASGLTAAQVAEGNVNLIFRVSSSSGRSVLVKQALPYAWRYPDFKMPTDRSRIEYEVLQLEARYCPQHVPKVHLYDAERCILVLEDLNRHLIMREGLMRGNRYPRVAEAVGVFAARTLFYTSDLYLSSGDKKAMLTRFMNPVLCKVQEDLVFTQPYIDHPNNRWTRLLDPQAASIRANDELRAEVLTLKELYMTHAQALLHNDLHTGSILLNETETRVIDPEFAFFGPIGHDVGTYLANLVIGYAAQEFHGRDPGQRASYRRWLLESFRQTWNHFEAEFLRLWEKEGNADWPSLSFRKAYLRQLLQDSAGFGGAEIMRRIIGMAHVHDFWTIQDEPTRATAESLALNVAESWILRRRSLASVDELAAIVASARSSYPFA